MEELQITPLVLGHLPDGIPLLGGMPITNTLVTGLIASVLLMIAALLVRFLVFPKFKELPRGLQNVVELIVESMQNYTNSKVGSRAGEGLGPYMFTIAAYMAVNGLLELVGFEFLRPAPSDINQTIALALITFILIRVLAYRKKGFWGRIKTSFLQPVPFIAPVKLITDLAVPVSLSCRMFGNLLGGLVIMQLLYGLGVFSFVIPAFASTFFTLFHTGMQAFIFITLSLAFIEEAME